MPSRVLMGPGPSDVHWRVLRALSAPTIGHLDPAFLEIVTETQQLLRSVFRCGNGLTLPVSGTGSAGMQACLVNLLEPGDEIAVVSAGVFGRRMCDAAGRLGARVTEIEIEWGRAATPEQVASALEGRRPKILAAVHAETSTGVKQPIGDLAAIAREKGALLLVDCVTSLGGVEVDLDGWGADAAFSGTQKCLSCPPGLSPLSFGPAAVAVMEARSAPTPSWYLDLAQVKRYWGADRAYHHTAPINMIYALREALRLILEEGLERRWARHRLHHEALVAGVEAMGLAMYVPEPERLETLNAVGIPEGADDAETRRALLERFGLEIGGGLGALAGRVWRVGLMGESATERNVLLFLGGLESVLRAQGVAVSSGLAAAEDVYAAHDAADPAAGT